MAIGNPHQSAEFSQLAQQLYDPVSHEPMIDAVTLDCGHTMSQRTAEDCIKQKMCSIDNERVSSFVPNLNTRTFVQFFLTAHLASIPFTQKGLGTNAETIEKLEKLMSEQKLLNANMSSELKATREELKMVKEELQDFKRESEKNQAKEQAFHVKEQAKGRFALHLPPHSLESDALTKLNLSKYNITTDADLTSYLCYSTDITCIDLTGCIRITDASIATIVQNCPNLQAIRIEGTRITGTAIQILKAHLPNLPDLYNVSSYAFGKAKWETYFGDIGEEPSLPPNIHEILASPCPFDPTKTVRETHLLVLVPARVNGESLTLKLLDRLVQAPREGDRNALIHKGSYKPDLDQYGDVPCRESHWVLMTRDVLSGTRSKSFKDQCAILNGFKAYEVPTLLDSAVCILMEYVISGTRLFSDNPWRLTRCQEKYMDLQVSVGGFGVAGLYVLNDYGIGAHSLAARRKF